MNSGAKGWWFDGSLWTKASINTSWCLLGCAVGDLGTILYFQLKGIDWPIWIIMSLAILMGLVTSILLETIILLRLLSLRDSLKTAFGMSFISMLGMEIAMNATDVFMTGGAIITWRVLPFVLLAGFIFPLPYNYWRLKALGASCH